MIDKEVVACKILLQCNIMWYIFSLGIKGVIKFFSITLMQNIERHAGETKVFYNTLN